MNARMRVTAMRRAILAFFVLGSFLAPGDANGPVPIEDRVALLALRTRSNLLLLERAAGIIKEIEGTFPATVQEAWSKPYLPFREDMFVNAYRGDPLREVPPSVLQTLQSQSSAAPVATGKMPWDFVGPAPDNASEIYGSIQLSSEGFATMYWDPDGAGRQVAAKSIQIWYKRIPSNSVEAPLSKSELYDPKPRWLGKPKVLSYRKWYQLITDPFDMQLVVACTELEWAFQRFGDLINTKEINGPSEFLPEDWGSIMLKLRDAGEFSLLGLRNPYTGRPIALVPFTSPEAGSLTLYSQYETLARAATLKFPVRCLAFGRNKEIIYPDYLSQLNITYRLELLRRGEQSNRVLWREIFKSGKPN
jgi:hypothetical protein